ncbi:MAG TPA: hypothetical protein EYH54_01165 [Nautiliaceae bacterium]|nr:hypothetical protein [Nautiliaceae bacterium]
MKFILLFIASFLLANNLIITYPNLKKEYYKDQIINLTIKVITPKEVNITAFTDFKSEINVTNNKFTHIINLYYKPQNNSKLFIVGNEIYKEINLSSLYTLKELPKIENFCKVLANNLEITNIIASKFNSNYNLLSFSIKGENSNLKDFSIGLKDENLSLVSPDEATFLGLIDKNKTEISFYYFNLSNETFNKITLPINIKEETISTQTNINPTQGTLFTPINILILTIITFLIVLFLVYQKIWLIFFTLILTGILIYNNLPKGEVYLPYNTKIYILPTKNSTVFYITPVGKKAKILKKLNDYTKIEIDNKIGWVKNEDIR